MDDVKQKMVEETRKLGIRVMMLPHDFSFPLVTVDGYVGDEYEPTKYGAYVSNDEKEHVVVPVNGTFAWRPPPNARFTGPVVDTESLTMLVHQLRENDNVETVTFAIDSPGGDARGNAELHKAVCDLAESKSVTALNTNMMCSAAYYAFCGANKILSENPNVETGSIGCYSMLWSQNRALKHWGIDVELVSSGGVKGHGHTALPISQEYIQQNKLAVDEIANEFRAAVTATRSKVNKEIAFNGFYWMHNKAQNLGLVDGLYNAEGNDTMDENLIAQLTESIGALSDRISKFEAAADKPAPKTDTPAPTPSALNDDTINLLIEVGRGSGAVTPGNEAQVRAALVGVTSIEQARATIDALTPAIKSKFSTSDAGAVDSPTTDMVAEAFDGLITMADIQKFKGANSYSLVDRCVRAVEGDIRIPHKAGRKIEKGKEPQHVRGSIDAAMAFRGVQ